MTSSSSPGRSAPRGSRFATARCLPCRTASTRASASLGWRPRCSTSRTGSRQTPGTSRSAPAVRLAIELERVPLAEGAELDDLGFGEDYELLATTLHPRDFPVIGRVEEGEGVELTLGGEPYSLAGWEHFR